MSLADAGLAGAQAEYYRNKKPEPIFNSLVKIRQCLKCDKDFKSEGSGNRICSDCNISNLRHGRRCSHETASRSSHVNNTPQRLG